MGEGGAAAASALDSISARRPSLVSFDGQGVVSWDSSLVTFVHELAERMGEMGVKVDLSGLPDGVQRLLALADARPERAGAPRAAASRPWLARLGDRVFERARRFRSELGFVGEVSESLGRFVSGRSGARGIDLLREVGQAGARALPIITLTSFLLGMIMAFVGAVALRPFGAGIYVANVVTIAMLRELSSVLTAIVMAGRTGSAYAAQLATMNLTQELDALTTMGIGTVDFLVLPRVAALSLMQPLLCVYSNFVGIAWRPSGGGRNAGSHPGAVPAPDPAGRHAGHVLHRGGQERGFRRAGGLPRLSGRAADGAQRRLGRRRGNHGHGERHRGHHRRRRPLRGDLPGAGGLIVSTQITARGLTIGFGGSIVLRDLSFTIRRGDIFVIMGGSGSGKSTLLRSLLGLQEAAGEIWYGSDQLTGADPARRQQILRRAGVLFQGGALFTSMTLAENVGLPLEMHTDLPPGEIAGVVELKLALVGLRGFEALYPNQLSGGMQKRAGLARAMALDPEILFLDEPSAGLDPISAHRLDELIAELRANLGTTVVLVSHELDSIFKLGDDSIFLDGETGRVIAAGRPRDLMAHAQERKVIDFLTRGGEHRPPEEHHG
jgi:phospholipid/cholesterol/gamma-HCH transport system ATP-binding protein